MQLLYKGLVRRISGSGMAYANFEKEIPLRCEKTPLAVPDTYIKINAIEDNQVKFDVFFFDEPTNVTLKLNETSKYQKEGNAFAFEIEFKLI